MTAAPTGSTPTARGRSAGTTRWLPSWLWNYTPEVDDLHRLVGPLGREPAIALARRLIAFAEDSGGADNVTVAVGPHELDLPIDEPNGQEEAT